jgi:hypothetical protein
MTLGKGGFVDQGFAESALPNAALGKAFAECKRNFPECLRHLAKNMSPVVTDIIYHKTIYVTAKFNHKTSLRRFCSCREETSNVIN